MADPGTDAARRARTMLLVFSGLPGVGKSTLAARVCRALRTPLLSVDPVESAMLRAGVAAGFATGLAAYLVVETLAASQLQLGQDAVVDAVNAVEPAKDIWRALAATHDADLVIIECRCSDEIIHRARLADRRRGLAEGFAEPSWEDVEQRRFEYTPWREPLLEVDTVASLDSNVSRILVWIADRRRSNEE